MSHFTNIQTCFQNLLYLEKALDRLEIPNFKANELTETKSLILPQGENKNTVSLGYAPTFSQLVIFA